MKNLFKYATKELSQDAFLRWLFENYEDQYLGPVVVDFINTFTADQYEPKLRPQLSLKYGDITKLKTCAQKNDIDVTIIDALNKRINFFRFEPRRKVHFDVFPALI